ncbi:MAG: hypothetical protein QOD06_510 [Candidatus Binatota bacterium]|jgi:hypothetical protein|nr:hypothetical protein [Candidatus Binatota bacterium]
MKAGTTSDSDRTGRFSRRQFLRAAGALGGAALVGRRALAQSVPPVPSFVGSLEHAKLASQHEVWEWQNFMVDLGIRLPGSPQHVRYLDFLEEGCARAGLRTFHDPTQRYPRWEADYTKCALSILEDDGSATDVEAMSYFPGSGNTSKLPGGALVGPLVDAGQGLPEDFAAGIATGSMKGAIAFCTEPRLPTTDALAYPNYYLNDPDMTVTPVTPYRKWSLSILSPQSVATPALAEQAGCAGMIIALEATRKCALGQYVSFLLTEVRGDQANGAPGMPILYVDYRTGQYIKSRLQALGSTTRARMVLPSKTHPNTGTDEIVAFLPGATGDANDPSKGENVIIASHTDGTSASEENGPLGMLALAKYFAKIPRSQRRRSLVFCFATGHFTDAYTKDTAWFTAHHPEIVANTVATLTVEHLGQKSYTDDPQADTYTYDGFPELALSYVSQHPLLIESVIANYQTENLTRAAVINGPGFGVSQAFFNANLPSYAFITGPNTLYQMDRETVLEGTDPARMHQEIRTFARILKGWENLSKEELRAGAAV